MEDKYNLLDKEKSTEEHYVIRHGVKEIYEEAFVYCDQILSITIPDTVKYIGESAFYGCKGLTSIEIPNSVTIINKYAFSECHGVTSIEIPYSVLYIGEGAFSNCLSLTSILVDEQNCNYSSLNGVLYNKDISTINCVPAGISGAFSIPQGVKIIEHSAFKCCITITSVDIPNSVVDICPYAFVGCKSLSTIVIPDSVTYIGYFAFNNCIELKELAIPKDVEIIGDYAFSWCNKLNLSLKSNNYFIIEEGALYDKEKTELLYVPINSSGEFTIPSGVTNIRYGSFTGCEKLTNIIIPDSTFVLEPYTFNSCKGLESITIPSSVEKIDNHIFYNCDNLKEIHCKIRNPKYINIRSKAFDGFNIDACTLYIPIGRSYAYRQHPIFSKFKKIVTEEAHE